MNRTNGEEKLIMYCNKNRLETEEVQINAQKKLNGGISADYKLTRMVNLYTALHFAI